MNDMTDSEKLRTLAKWFDECYKGDSLNRDVQADLLRIADELEQVKFRNT